MITFSVNRKEPRKKYLVRNGVYGLFSDRRGLLAVVKTKTGYFLPGGGIENNETQKDCLIRECLEEIGIEIAVKEKIAIGTYYFRSSTINRDMVSIGHFFKCEVLEKAGVKTEPDHKLVWLAPKNAAKSLYLENQKEAVNLFFNL